MNIKINQIGFQVDDCHAEFWKSVEDGTWEPFAYSIINRLLVPGMTFLDAGAWIGPLSIYAAKLGNRVIAIEPDPVAFDFLTQNIKRNECKVETRRLAVADYGGMLHMESNELGDSMTRECAREQLQKVDIACIRLDELCRDISGPLFIKLDVEGAEELILRNTALFAERKPILYLSTHPSWWSSPWDVIESICRLARIYKHALTAATMEPATGICSEMLFSDQI